VISNLYVSWRHNNIKEYGMKKISVLFVLIVTVMLTVFMNGIYATSPKSADLPENNGDTKAEQDVSCLSGRVVETMNSGGYTYVKIEKDAKETWVAVPQMEVVVGQEISFEPGMVMSNFTSKTLNRTFESIIFSGGPIGHQEMKSICGSPHPIHGKSSTIAAIQVEKAPGPNAYTVVELYEKRTELDKKEVVVKGQVVKVSANIMGKNWIHLQDGSGEPSKSNYDLLVTSQETFSVGDIVSAKGILYKDKDFGSGYKYAVILEATNIKK